MKTSFRLSQPARDAINAESERTGKTQSQVIEDFVTWRRVFREDAEDAMLRLCRATMAAPRKVIEAALLVAERNRDDVRGILGKKNEGEDTTIENGDPTGIRTPAATVKGERQRGHYKKKSVDGSSLACMMRTLAQSVCNPAAWTAVPST